MINDHNGGVMARNKQNYDNEIVNLRAFYLRLLRKIWLIPLAAVIGAVVGGIIYFLATVVYAPARNYKAESTLYIYFAYDEDKGSQVDYYNAYTWNTLIRTDEAVIGVVMDNLKNGGNTDDRFSREKVVSALSADIPSDVRVMILTVTAPDKESCEAILEAADNALVAYGESNTAFKQIKLLGKSDPGLEVITDRSLTAIILGAACAVVLLILAELLLESMDDAIYVPEDAEKRYGIPVLGVMTSQGEEAPAFFRNELLSLTDKYLHDVCHVAVLSVDDRNDDSRATAAADRMKEIAGSNFDKLGIELIPMATPSIDTESVKKLDQVDGAVIMVSMGKRNGAMTQHQISLLRKLNCQVLGIVLTGADKNFLINYLGL